MSSSLRCRFVRASVAIKTGSGKKKRDSRTMWGRGQSCGRGPCPNEPSYAYCEAGGVGGGLHRHTWFFKSINTELDFSIQCMLCINAIAFWSKIFCTYESKIDGSPVKEINGGGEIVVQTWKIPRNIQAQCINFRHDRPVATDLLATRNNFSNSSSDLITKC